MFNTSRDHVYRSDPTFSDRYVWANSTDPDQAPPRGAVWSGSTLFAIPSASFGCITLRKHHLVQLLGWLQQIFWLSEILGFYSNIFFFFLRNLRHHSLGHCWKRGNNLDLLAQYTFRVSMGPHFHWSRWNILSRSCGNQHNLHMSN